MLQRRLSKRHQGQVHTRRVMAGRRRKVRASEMRRRTDRRAGCAPARDAASPPSQREDHAAPARDRLELGIAQALVVLCLSEKAANRYWHMIPCSSSAASQSM